MSLYTLLETKNRMALTLEIVEAVHQICVHLHDGSTRHITDQMLFTFSPSYGITDFDELILVDQIASSEIQDAAPAALVPASKDLREHLGNFSENPIALSRVAIGSSPKRLMRIGMSGLSQIITSRRFNIETQQIDVEKSPYNRGRNQRQAFE